MLASICCHTGIEFFQGNVLKMEKECKFLYGPKSAEAELLISFNASIKFKKLPFPAAVSKALPAGELSITVVDDSPPLQAPWSSSVSTSPLKRRLLVANHRMSVSSVGALF